MKTQNQLLGMIAALVFIIGVAFKLEHFPGAQILMLLGAFLGIVYMLIYLIQETKTLTAGLEKVSGVIGAITMILVLAGFLFKISHWPGAGILIIISQVFLLISSTLIMIDSHREADVSKRNYKALLAFMIFILMTILIYLSLYSH